jgi:hypothetical protein
LTWATAETGKNIPRSCASALYFGLTYPKTLDVMVTALYSCLERLYTHAIRESMERQITRWRSTRVSHHLLHSLAQTDSPRYTQNANLVLTYPPKTQVLHHYMDPQSSRNPSGAPADQGPFSTLKVEVPTFVRQHTVPPQSNHRVSAMPQSMVSTRRRSSRDPRSRPFPFLSLIGSLTMWHGAARICMSSMPPRKNVLLSIVVLDTSYCGALRCVGGCWGLSIDDVSLASKSIAIPTEAGSCISIARR